MFFAESDDVFDPVDGSFTRRRRTAPEDLLRQRSSFLVRLVADDAPDVGEYSSAVKLCRYMALRNPFASRRLALYGWSPVRGKPIIGTPW